MFMIYEREFTEKLNKRHSNIVYWQLIPARPENLEELVTGTCSSNSNTQMPSARLFWKYFILLFWEIKK